ncbi:MAG: DUF58 domain-containing protein [Microbacteriaceae bacterium]|nr:DUF58 domain-containing protein [Microbacteriaceae bacterium]MCI1206892.1 DUF58 domain-containing protein [Microbacteriaceae bacterium]
MTRQLRSVELTAPGRLAGVLAVLGTVGGTSLGWGELWGAGLLSAVLLLFAGAVLGRHLPVSVTVRPSRSRASVGVSVWCEVSVQNPGRLAARRFRLEAPVGAELQGWEIDELRPGERRLLRVPVPTRCRGIVSLGPVRCIRQDPLGLIRRVQGCRGEATVTVHPRTVRVDAAPGLESREETVPHGAGRDAGVEFRDLQRYRPGDRPGSMVWRPGEEGLEPLTKRFEELSRPPLLVLLATDVDEYATPEEFELGVSVAASLCLAALRVGRPVALAAGGAPGRDGTRIPAGVARARALLDRFASVQCTGPGLRTLVRGVHGRAGGASAVLISGSGCDLREWRACGMLLGRASTRIGIWAGRSGRMDAGLPLLGVRTLPGISALRRARW